MTITAKIIEDSIGPGTRRLTTFQLMYPRFIHAEVMTHRQFSRNASSSRAIPVEKQIAMIKADTAMPVHWGMNQSGMQAEQETDALLDFMDHRYDFPPADMRTPQEAWIEARDRAIDVAERFVAAGYHKQVVNRILEPFSHISVIVTSSQYDNFFALRSHKDAQPEIKVLSDLMLEAYNASTPRVLGLGEWHLPYITSTERMMAAGAEVVHDDGTTSPAENELIKISAARCARVSYLTHDGNNPSLVNDMKLYDRLVGSVPLHASPVEHQATPDTKIYNTAGLPQWENPGLHGNLSGGWIQYRKTLPDECCDNWEDPQDPLK